MDLVDWQSFSLDATSNYMVSIKPYLLKFLSTKCGVLHFHFVVTDVFHKLILFNLNVETTTPGDLASSSC